jgi:cyanophycinase
MRRFVTALALLVLGLAAVPAPAISAAPAPGGHLVLIGGGEKPLAAMQKFVELAGGKDAPIVVFPTASEEADAAEYYANLFVKELGCTRVAVLDLKTREDAARADFAEQTKRARGVFFGGGDQSRITRALLDTPVGAAVDDAFARGAVVGGTSAGTACQSALMITGEGDFTVIRAGAVELARGLGLFPGVIVDQHFVARQRSNRLLSAILEHPVLLGIGVDEDTAIWVTPEGTMEVIGERSVVVIDAAKAKVSRAAAAGGKDLLGVRGLRLEVLLPGDRYDLRRRRPLGRAAHETRR